MYSSLSGCSPDPGYCGNDSVLVYLSDSKLETHSVFLYFLNQPTLTPSFTLQMFLVLFPILTWGRQSLSKFWRQLGALTKKKKKKKIGARQSNQISSASCFQWPIASFCNTVLPALMANCAKKPAITGYLSCHSKSGAFWVFIVSDMHNVFPQLLQT